MTQTQVVELLVGELIDATHRPKPSALIDEMSRLAATAPVPARAPMRSNFAIDPDLVEAFKRYSCEQLQRTQMQVLGWLVDYVFGAVPPGGPGGRGRSKLVEFVVDVIATGPPSPSRNANAALPGQLELPPVKS